MSLLGLTYFLPLIISILLALPKRFSERTITWVSAGSLILPAMTSLGILIMNLAINSFPLEINLGNITLFSHSIPFILWFDKFTLSMLALTHILGLLVVKYSHGYLHLEKGYQRFFSTILFFIFGMYVLSMAGTMDLFFAGWEVVGFSSFLLIAFYRSHTRSVLNAWRIYNIYRICDVGLLMGAVIGHILWHEATRFSVLSRLSTDTFSSINDFSMIVMSLLLIFASLGKSAQFPFHNWPSRAMEGPTPSSAIFYGALSIHAGVFLLIRTHSIWSHHDLVRVLVGLIGFLTLVLSFLQGKVQSNIKGQIAFASTAQIGLMFIELSLGLIDLAMLHLFTHALYRCFQLLVSPSIVANSLTTNNLVVMERIEKNRRGLMNILPRRLSRTLYVLGMNDFFMDISWRGFHFVPWKRAYYLLMKVLTKPIYVVPALIALTFLANTSLSIPLILAELALYMAARSFLVHHSAFKAVLELTLALAICSLTVLLLDSHYLIAVWSYMSSVGPCLMILLYIGYKFKDKDLRLFHALGTAHSLWANIFFLCFMVVAGMPVSTAFFGEDILLEEIIKHSHVLTLLIMSVLMINGLLCAKLYTRLFMGRRPALNTELSGNAKGLK